MFSLRRPTPAFIDAQIAAARESPSPAPRTLFATGQPLAAAPPGYVRDFSESQLGVGQKAFAAAKDAMQRWTPFDLGWVRMANPYAAIRVGEIVAVEVHSLGLWSLNLSRIVDVVDTPERFGFVYSTTQLHVEKGEERFLLRFDAETGEVHYELEAVSRPSSALARLGYPVTRHFQHRFVRDSHRRMRAAVDSPDLIS